MHLAQNVQRLKMALFLQLRKFEKILMSEIQARSLNFSYLMSLNYSQNSPLDVPTYAYGIRFVNSASKFIHPHQRLLLNATASIFLNGVNCIPDENMKI